MLLWETTDFETGFSSHFQFVVFLKNVFIMRVDANEAAHDNCTAWSGENVMQHCSTADTRHTALLRPHLETINPGLRATVISRWLLYKFVCNVGGWLGGNDHLKNHDDQLYRWIVGPGVSQYCTAHAGTETD